MTISQSRYWYGVLIYDICAWLQVDKQDYENASPIIHQALKKCFSIRSLSDLSSQEFEKVTGTILMLWAREFGYMLRDPSEKGIDPNTMTMKEFLKHKNLI